MSDHKSDKPDADKLPGNNGQFGVGDATETYKPLENEPIPEDMPAKEKADQGPKQTNAGERS